MQGLLKYAIYKGIIKLKKSPSTGVLRESVELLKEAKNIYIAKNDLNGQACCSQLLEKLVNNEDISEDTLGKISDENCNVFQLVTQIAHKEDEQLSKELFQKR